MNELLVIQSKIYELRGQKIMFDYDLASMYGVETRVLNQAVKRNITRFPEDFMFQLTREEWESMSSQFVMTYSTKYKDINEDTRTQLEAINITLAELQTRRKNTSTRRIGFNANEE